MIYLLGVVVLLLAAAVVALFAMMGELHAQLAENPGGGTVHPLTDAATGHTPDVLPEPLAGLATAERAIVLVLSTVCTSCAAVAEQLADEPRPVPGHELFLAVSTPDAAHGEEFRHRPGLDQLPSYVDVDGDWARTEFNVRHSPSALVFRRGRLLSAMVFNDVATLRRAMSTATREVTA